MCPGEWWHKPEALQSLSVAEGAHSIMRVPSFLRQYCKCYLLLHGDKEDKLDANLSTLSSVHAYCSLTYMKYCPETHPGFFVRGPVCISRQCPWITMDLYSEAVGPVDLISTLYTFQGVYFRLVLDWAPSCSCGSWHTHFESSFT